MIYPYTFAELVIAHHGEKMSIEPCETLTEEARVGQGGKPKGDFEALAEHLTKQQRTLPALNRQVGGDHYIKLPIQVFEFTMANGLDPMQHTVIKYVTRFRDKGGIDDLEKAKHTIDLLIEYEKLRGVQKN